jgi:hypothetical protein
MAMRTRTYTEYHSIGERRTNTSANTLLNTYQNTNVHQRCTDDVRPGDNHYFFTVNRTNSGNIVNGITSGSLGRRHVNLLADDFRLFDQTLYAHWPDTARPSDAMLVAKLLAETNPNRADVDIPTFLGELRDIPQLFVREATRIKRLAGANLKYQFGVKPLVRDVLKLLDFQTLVLEREKELQALYESGLERTRLLYKSKVTGNRVNHVHNRDKFSLFSHSDITSIRNVYGYVRFFPYGPLTKISAGDLRKQARKAALGLTVDFNTAYQLMPWSWLLDWCSNVGDIVSNTRNIIPVTYNSIRIIESIKTTAKTSYPGSSVISPGTWGRHDKIRNLPATAGFDSQLPRFTPRQLSILGSIGVTRRLPRSF